MSILDKIKDITSDIMVAPFKVGLKIKEWVNTEKMIADKAEENVRKKFAPVGGIGGNPEVGISFKFKEIERIKNILKLKKEQQEMINKLKNS